MLESQPWRRPLPHSTASTTRSSVCARLDLDPARPAAAGLVGRVERLDHDALVARGEQPSPKNASASSASAVSSRGTTVLGGHQAPRARRARSLAGSVEQVAAVEVQDVEEVRRHRSRRRPRRRPSSARRGLLERPRPPVVVEQQRLAVEHEPRAPAAPRTASTSSGSRSVMSSRLRVQTATSSPSRCTWIRMPSSLPSTAPAAAGRLERGRERRARCRPASAAPGGRPRARTRRARRRPRSARPRRPRRCGAGQHRGAADDGRRDARTPRRRRPTSTPSSAPWRTSPVTRPRSSACSSAVARAEQRSSTCGALAPASPTPDTPGQLLERGVDLQHRQRRLVGRRRAGRSATRQPTPVRRWVSEPDEVAATTTTSSGGRPQARGDGGDLGHARAGGAHGVEGGDQVAQPHGSIQGRSDGSDAQAAVVSDGRFRTGRLAGGCETALAGASSNHAPVPTRESTCRLSPAAGEPHLSPSRPGRRRARGRGARGSRRWPRERPEVSGA